MNVNSDIIVQGHTDSERRSNVDTDSRSKNGLVPS